MQMSKEKVTKQSTVSLFLIDLKYHHSVMYKSNIILTNNQLEFTNKKKPSDFFDDSLKGINKSIIALSKDIIPLRGHLTLDAYDGLVYINDVFEDGFNVTCFFTCNQYWLPISYFKGIAVAIGTESNIRHRFNRTDLPILSTAFTAKFVDLYNKGNQISKANIKMIKNDGEWEVYTDKQNVVTMSPIRNNFTREDVFNLFSEFEKELEKRDDYDSKLSPSYWISEKIDKITL